MKVKKPSKCHQMPKATSKYLGHFKKSKHLNAGHNTIQMNNVEDGLPDISLGLSVVQEQAPEEKESTKDSIKAIVKEIGKYFY